ncbi:MAG: HTTM domain-containing protein [Myxococcota bacterium]
MRAFAIFAFLWALSALFDLIPRAAWLDSPAHFFLAASAVVVVLQPSSRLAFAVFNVLRLVAFVTDSPDTPNHQVLFALGSASILWTGLAHAWQTTRERSGSPFRISGEAWLRAFAPVLRAELVLLYFFAVLHKLNWAYFDPSVSCALHTLSRLTQAPFKPWIPEGEAAQLLVIFGSLAIEASVPVLLCIPRTRMWGVILGFIFHGFLGLGYFHFSTGVIALLILFIPTSALDHAFGRLEAWRTRQSWRRWLTREWVPGLISLGLVLAMVEMREIDRIGYRMLRLVWLAGVVCFLLFLLGTRQGWSSWRGAAPGRLRDARLVLIFPLLLFFLGLSPYLGLRTVPASSMFSNLRTEGGVTNHLFMPARALRVASYQEDLVEIEAASDPGLRRWARQGSARVFYDLQRQIQEMAAGGETDIAIRFLRSGRRYDLGSAELNPELTAPHSWLDRKWLAFRPVPGERPPCSW